MTCNLLLAGDAFVLLMAAAHGDFLTRCINAVTALTRSLLLHALKAYALTTDCLFHQDCLLRLHAWDWLFSSFCCDFMFCSACSKLQVINIS